jgi:predicted Fe-Mo cluster-binding NifX family protein
MKIALTSQNRKTITGHAGKCRKFWIYEVEHAQIKGRTLLELPKEQSFHESHGAEPHPLDGVNVLISGGMGAGLQFRLRQRGIDALITPETDPDRAVAAYLTGTLPLGEAESHEHHDHEHDHHHDNRHGHHHAGTLHVAGATIPNLKKKESP